MNTLNTFEKSLLQNLNSRALKIVKIEQAFKEVKVPFNSNFLYEMTDENLDNTLELAMNLKLQKHAETNE